MVPRHCARCAPRRSFFPRDVSNAIGASRLASPQGGERDTAVMQVSAPLLVVFILTPARTTLRRPFFLRPPSSSPLGLASNGIRLSLVRIGLRGARSLSRSGVPGCSGRAPLGGSVRDLMWWPISLRRAATPRLDSPPSHSSSPPCTHRAVEPCRYRFCEMLSRSSFRAAPRLAAFCACSLWGGGCRAGSTRRWCRHRPFFDSHPPRRCAERLWGRRTAAPTRRHPLLSASRGERVVLSARQRCVDSLPPDDTQGGRRVRRPRYAPHPFRHRRLISRSGRTVLRPGPCPRFVCARFSTGCSTDGSSVATETRFL
jgi:hypothetical protein